jgi:hypothetical protein
MRSMVEGATTRAMLVPGAAGPSTMRTVSTMRPALAPSTAFGGPPPPLRG